MTQHTHFRYFWDEVASGFTYRVQIPNRCKDYAVLIQSTGGAPFTNVVIKNDIRVHAAGEPPGVNMNLHAPGSPYGSADTRAMQFASGGFVIWPVTPGREIFIKVSHNEASPIPVLLDVEFILE